MREFISKALKRIPVMDEEQLRRILPRIIEEFLLLDSMMDSLNTGVILVNAENAVIKTNRAASRILGKNITEGQRIDACSGYNEICGFITEVIATQTGETQHEFVLQNDNMRRYVQVTVLPLVEDKRVSGTIIIADDITIKKHEEIQKRRLDNLTSLTNVAATVAHEIKNPLAAISIHIQLLRKKINSLNVSVDEQSIKHIDVVEEEIERLNKIIVDFLFAVRPLKFHFDPVNINTLITDLYTTFDPELSRAHISFFLTLEHDIPAIHGDERFLRQSLINIITNAVASMPDGGILNIRTKAEDGAIFIRISDTGVGIPYENLQKVFEPYFTTKSNGTGLGLPMAYKVIKEHGGDIYVRSEPEKGTEFTLLLPITHSNHKLLPQKKQAQEF